MTTGERVDVLVIGAGAAGAAVAWMLARAGIGVTCLEQGDWVDPKTYPHWQPDWELHRHTDWSPEPNVRRLPQDYHPILATAAASPELDALLCRALHAIAEAAGANRFASMSADDRETVLRRVEESQPEAFATLVRHTYFGYYGHPTVITALGLDPTPVHPRGHHPDPLDPPDLARVTKRGPIYRPT